MCLETPRRSLCNHFLVRIKKTNKTRSEDKKYGEHEGGLLSAKDLSFIEGDNNFKRGVNCGKSRASHSEMWR